MRVGLRGVLGLAEGAFSELGSGLQRCAFVWCFHGVADVYRGERGASYRGQGE